MYGIRPDQTICKVDKFIGPDAARAGFRETVFVTHTLLRTVPGFLRDYLLEKVEGPGSYDIVTLVEWVSVDVLQLARIAVQGMHEPMYFHPANFWACLGIQADIANYQAIDETEQA